MASQYPYRRVIYDEFLHTSKEVKARSIDELALKCEEQYAKWKVQAAPKRATNHAISSTREALERIESYKTILVDGLDYISPDWNNKYKHDKYPMFQYLVIEPKLSDFFKYYDVPKKTFWEYIFPFLRKKREKAELVNKELQYEAELQYDEALSKYNTDKNDKYKHYLDEKERFEDSQKKHNESIDEKKRLIELNDKDVVEEYFTDVFVSQQFIDDFYATGEMEYNQSIKELVVNANLPQKSCFSNVCGYKYVASRKSTDKVYLKEKEYNEIYDSAIKQIVLRIIYVIFTADKYNNLDSLCVNGYVSGFDGTNGQPINPCVLSIHLKKEKFKSINFRNIDINSCIRSLNGLYVGNISNLSPVKPIRFLNTEDKRFIEGKQMLDNEEKINMAEMPWEDFEHLVRELFSKYFSSEGAEVKVTQASRDGGIDAVAFDPDPIKGGKYIIQAKRYNIVVPVSAVRELYGVVVSEGADKGILVTTSDFGSDSVEFAKEKPISLINGANLLYLLNKFGYNNYEIELSK